MNHSKVRPGKGAPLSQALRNAHFGGDDRYMRYGVHEDGSCFFHAVCAAMNIRGYRNRPLRERSQIGKQFRKKIRKRISQSNWDRIWKRRGVTANGGRLPQVETIMEMLGNHTTWADVYIILYVMDKININMIFFDLTTNDVYCGVRGVEAHNQRSVLIAWVNRSHFEPIYRSSADKDVFFYPSDDPFIRELMTRYASELCPHRTDIRDII
jgi:hypothetical protein